MVKESLEGAEPMEGEINQEHESGAREAKRPEGERKTQESQKPKPR